MKSIIITVAVSLQMTAYLLACTAGGDKECSPSSSETETSDGVKCTTLWQAAFYYTCVELPPGNNGFYECIESDITRPCNQTGVRTCAFITQQVSRYAGDRSIRLTKDWGCQGYGS